MLLFLTSSPSGALDEPNEERLLDFRNGFVKNLQSVWKENMRVLMISADFATYDSNDEMVSFFADAFNNSGLKVDEWNLWDDRSEDITTETLCSYDMVILGGGHVPTQNAIFHAIHLREMMQDYDGIVMGISAGSMNCADRVYAQPEMPNESIDPNYSIYLEGLALTDLNVLPHYQMVKDNILDGKRLYEDITFSHSYGNNFLILVDGSYVIANEEESWVFGEAYYLGDGKMSQICAFGDSVQIE